MRISSYLATSRHGLYYFRFPIPSRYHPEDKQSCIRFSLETRCPREAAHIARMLGYAGDQMLRQILMGMDYNSIRNVLHEHFKAMLERHKHRLATYGHLPSKGAVALKITHALGSDYTFMETDDHLAQTIKQVGLENYEFKATSASVPSTSKPKQKKLADYVEIYCAERVRLKQWREHVAREFRRQFDLMLEYLGQDASLHVSSDVASDVKNMLLYLPSHRTKGTLKHLTLREQILTLKQ